MMGPHGNAIETTSSETPWFLDSSATHHFTPDSSNLDNSMPFLGEELVMMRNGNTISISNISSIVLKSPFKDTKLNHIFHMLAISKQLLSVSKLCHDNKAFFEFHPNFFLVKDLCSRNILLENFLYGLTLIE